MIADAAHLFLLFIRDALIACALIVAVACIYAWSIRHWDAYNLRRRAKEIHEAGPRRSTPPPRITETRAAVNRDHPLHSLGGRFR
jgi:hypothetical protein